MNRHEKKDLSVIAVGHPGSELKVHCNIAAADLLYILKVTTGK